LSYLREEGFGAEENQSERGVRKDENKNKLAVPPLAAARTNLLVFQEYVRYVGAE
jgi:hypothetical protein